MDRQEVHSLRNASEELWAQQNGIDHAKDGQVDTWTNGQREHGNGVEAGVLQQLAEGEFEVVHGCVVRKG